MKKNSFIFLGIGIVFAFQALANVAIVSAEENLTRLLKEQL